MHLTYKFRLQPSRPSIQALLDVCDHFALGRDHACLIVRDMAIRIHQNWRPMADKLGFSSDEIRYYAQAFEHKEMKVAITLMESKPSPVTKPGISNAHKGNLDQDPSLC